MEIEERSKGHTVGQEPFSTVTAQGTAVSLLQEKMRGHLGTASTVQQCCNNIPRVGSNGGDFIGDDGAAMAKGL